MKVALLILALTHLVPSPPAFLEMCSRLSWVCSGEDHATSDSGYNTVDIVRINNEVNNTITPKPDPDGLDYWSLPIDGNGDCEDYATEKFKRLLEAGVGRENIRLAVVVNGNKGNHVVLLVRHLGADLVLDNLTSKIKVWSDTKYRFLAVQIPNNREVWEVVDTGGR